MKFFSSVVIGIAACLISFFSISFAQDSSLDTLVNTIDTMYTKIVKKLPTKLSSTSRLGRKIQDKFWSTIQSQLQEKIKTAEGQTLLLYQALLTKIQQRASVIQFPTSDIVLQLQLIDATNRIRKENKLPSLTYSFLLSLSAYNHAKDMYDNFPNKNWEVLSHYGTDGGTVKERVAKVGYARSALAENIARNQTDVQEVMDDWMNSPSHRENILSDKVTEIGVAKVGPYRVQNFWKPKKNK